MLGAEALGLEQRVPGQLRSRDAGREAEIVLDPRAGAGLTAGGDRVGGEHVEPFGRRVHRGGEPGGAGADHDEVVDVVVSSVSGEAGAAGEVGKRGIL